jgi:hypothetical protein
MTEKSIWNELDEILNMDWLSHKRLHLLLEWRKEAEAEWNALKVKAAKWDGYEMLLATTVEIAKKAELHIEEDPLLVPNTYLETVMDYIVLGARNIETRNELEQVQKKLEKIRELADDERNWSPYGNWSPYFLQELKRILEEA